MPPHGAALIARAAETIGVSVKLMTTAVFITEMRIKKWVDGVRVEEEMAMEEELG